MTGDTSDVIVLSARETVPSNDRLVEEARRQGARARRVDPAECVLEIQGGALRVVVGGVAVEGPVVVLPRDGAETSDGALAAVRHFEAAGVPVVNRASSVAATRDKFRALQVLAAAGLPVPDTALPLSPEGVPRALEAAGGAPSVLKLLRGTEGIGVMIADSENSVASILEAFWATRWPALVQELVQEARGRDLRVFVVGGEVVAAMARHGPPGEFRANIALGGRGEPVAVDDELERLSVTAARVFDLDVAGVDVLESARGPLVVEVNSAPDFVGLESATGLNVARRVADLALGVAAPPSPEARVGPGRRGPRLPRPSLEVLGEIRGPAPEDLD